MWLTGERRGVGGRYSPGGERYNHPNLEADSSNLPAMAADLRKPKSTFANQTGHFCE